MSTDIYGCTYFGTTGLFSDGTPYGRLTAQYRTCDSAAFGDLLVRTTTREPCEPATSEGSPKTRESVVFTVTHTVYFFSFLQKEEEK